MSKTILATFDGKALWPDESIGIQPNTRVRITIEESSVEETKAYSFLHLAQSLNLKGPHDWSERLEEYLYQKKDEL